MTNKSVFFIVLFVCISVSCGNPLERSDIHAEIKQYEWTELYDHEYDYEMTCEVLFALLPHRLFHGIDFFDSLTVKIDNKDEDGEISFDLFGRELQKCLIPAYGGKYMSGIPVKNRKSYEECYAATLEFLKTVHKEYIELGIIQKKQ